MTIIIRGRRTCASRISPFRGKNSRVSREIGKGGEKYINVDREFGGRVDSRIGFDPVLRFGQRTLRFEERQKTRMIPFPLLRFYDMTKKHDRVSAPLFPCPPSARFRVIQFYGPARLYPGISSLAFCSPCFFRWKMGEEEGRTGTRDSIIRGRTLTCV